MRPSRSPTIVLPGIAFLGIVILLGSLVAVRRITSVDPLVALGSSR